LPINSKSDLSWTYLWSEDNDFSFWDYQAGSPDTFDTFDKNYYYSAYSRYVLLGKNVFQSMGTFSKDVRIEHDFDDVEPWFVERIHVIYSVAAMVVPHSSSITAKIEIYVRYNDSSEVKIVENEQSSTSGRVFSGFQSVYFEPEKTIDLIYAKCTSTGSATSATCIAEFTIDFEGFQGHVPEISKTNVLPSNPEIGQEVKFTAWVNNVSYMQNSTLVLFILYENTSTTISFNLSQTEQFDESIYSVSLTLNLSGNYFWKMRVVRWLYYKDMDLQLLRVYESGQAFPRTAYINYWTPYSTFPIPSTLKQYVSSTDELKRICNFEDFEGRGVNLTWQAMHDTSSKPINYTVANRRMCLETTGNGIKAELQETINTSIYDSIYFQLKIKSDSIFANPGDKAFYVVLNPSAWMADYRLNLASYENSLNEWITLTIPFKLFSYIYFQDALAEIGFYSPASVGYLSCEVREIYAADYNTFQFLSDKVASTVNVSVSDEIYTKQCVNDTNLVLNSTQYNVTQTTFYNTSVQATADDAYVHHYTSSGEDVFYTSSILACAKGSWYGQAAYRRSYLRFQVEGDVVENATLLLYCYLTGGGVSSNIYLLDYDSCPSFPDGSMPDNYATTSDYVSVTFSSTGWHSINVTSLVESFMSRPGYSEGNYMGLRITEPAGTVYAYFESHDDGTREPRLEYYVNTISTFHDSSHNVTISCDFLDDVYLCNASLSIRARTNVSVEMANVSIFNFSSGSWMLNQSFDEDYKELTFSNLTGDFFNNSELMLHFETNGSNAHEIDVDYVNFTFNYSVYDKSGVVANYSTSLSENAYRLTFNLNVNDSQAFVLFNITYQTSTMQYNFTSGGFMSYELSNPESIICFSWEIWKLNSSLSSENATASISDVTIWTNNTYRLESESNRQNGNELTIPSQEFYLLLTDYYGNWIYREWLNYSQYIDILVPYFTISIKNEADQEILFRLEKFSTSLEFSIAPHDTLYLDIIEDDYEGVVIYRGQEHVLFDRAISRTSQRSFSFNQEFELEPDNPPQNPLLLFYLVVSTFLDNAIIRVLLLIFCTLIPSTYFYYKSTRNWDDRIFNTNKNKKKVKATREKKIVKKVVKKEKRFNPHL